MRKIHKTIWIHLISILIILLFSTLIQGQNVKSDCTQEELGANWMALVSRLGNYEKANSSELNLLATDLEAFRDCTKQLESWFNYGQTSVLIPPIHLAYGNTNAALASMDSLAANIEDKGLDKVDYDYLYSTMKFNYGRIYYEKGWYDLALGEFLKAEDIQMGYATKGQPPGVVAYDSLNNNISYTASNLFNNIALIYLRYGDFEKSREYFEISVRLAQTNSQFNASAEDRARTYQNLARVYTELGQFKKADYNFSKVLALIGNKRQGFEQRTLSLAYKNLAEYYRKTGKQDSSYYYIKKAMQLKTVPEFQVFNHHVYSNILMEDNDVNQAESELEKAAQIALENLGEFHPELARTYMYLGDLFRQQKKVKQAKSNYEKAMAVLSGEDVSGQFEPNNLTHKRLAIEILENQAELFELVDEPNLALEQYDKAIEVYKILRLYNLKSEGGKYMQAGRFKRIYEKAIVLAVKAGKKEQAYAYCRQGKSAVLLQQVQEEIAIKSSALPKQYLNKLQTIKSNINKWNKEWEDAIQSQNPDLAKAKKEAVESANLEYGHLVNEIEKKYPEYAKLKFELPEISLNEIQSLLKYNNSAIAEYFVGDYVVFGFNITPDNIEVVQVKNDTGFKRNVEMYLQSVSRFSTSQDAYEKHVKSAHFLYEKLLENACKNEFSNFNKLIIIPDEILNQIPFESLVMELPEKSPEAKPIYHALDYLVKTFDVSYQYAADLLVPVSNTEKEEYKNEFLGVAPSFEKRNISPLEHNMKEVSKINSIYENNVLVANEATHDSCMRLIPGHRIVHLATHAMFNDENPLDSRIELADTSLFIYEILALGQQPELVIMSACETAVGEQKKGEGVISLTRAFLQAGCPNVVASLWKVSDQKTGIIMRDFHKFLKEENQSVETALSSAKRKYISEAISDRTHPFYWAGFVKVGSLDVPDSSVLAWYWWGLGVVLLLAIVFISFRKK